MLELPLLNPNDSPPSCFIDWSGAVALIHFTYKHIFAHYLFNVSIYLKCSQPHPLQQPHRIYDATDLLCTSTPYDSVNLITVTISKQNSLLGQAHQPSSRVKNSVMYHMSTCEHLKERPVFNSWNKVFQFQFQMAELYFVYIFLDECDAVKYNMKMHMKPAIQACIVSC